MSYIETPADFPYPWYLKLNSFLGLERGAAMDKLRGLSQFEDSALYSDLEKAALAYAEAATRSDLGVNADLVSRLRKYLDDQALVELAALIAYQNMSSKFNAALGVPDSGFCAAPPPGAPGRPTEARPPIPNDQR